VNAAIDILVIVSLNAFLYAMLVKAESERHIECRYHHSSIDVGERRSTMRAHRPHSIEINMRHGEIMSVQITCIDRIGCIDAIAGARDPIHALINSALRSARDVLSTTSTKQPRAGKG
jgi:hypothetical protein